MITAAPFSFESHVVRSVGRASHPASRALYRPLSGATLGGGLAPGASRALNPASAGELLRWCWAGCAIPSWRYVGKPVNNLPGKDQAKDAKRQVTALIGKHDRVGSHNVSTCVHHARMPRT
jgi:hypothetical protein